MAHDIFISYSHKDKPTADAICAKLEAGGLRCWYAPRDITPGADWAPAIIDAIEGSRVLILVFTSHSNASQQVMREVSTAIQQGIPVIPFKLTDEEPSRGMQYYLATVHWLDAMDGPLYNNIRVLEERVRGALGEYTEKVPATKPERITATGSNKKWINFVVAGIIVVLVAVILWQAGVFGGRTPSVTEEPAEVPSETLTQAPKEVPAEALTEAPTEVPTEEPPQAPTEAPSEVPMEEPAQGLENTEASKEESSVKFPAGEDYPELRQMDEEAKKKVKRLIITGDKVYINFIYEDYLPQQNGSEDVFLYDRKAGKRIDTLPGTLTDLSLLDGMEKLDTLWLINQPLTSLKGIEKLARLKEVQVCGCNHLEDISAMFEPERIETINLQYNNHIKTLEGCEKLRNLLMLSISEEHLDDLSSLSRLDVSHAVTERGGLDIFIDCPEVHDYSWLSNIPAFAFIGIAHANPDLWINELGKCSIHRLGMVDCFRSGPEQFESFVEVLKKSHPEMTELHIDHNTDIMDLSGLAEMPNLKKVYVTEDMEDAIESLEGIQYHFELEIED